MEAARMSIERNLVELHTEPVLPSIPRVPEWWCDVNKDDFEPQIIAIGPYHIGKHNLKKEEWKLRYLQSLRQRQNTFFDAYLRAVADEEQRARGFYAEPIGLRSDEFIEMLILDGCFIIELILRYSFENPTSLSNDPIFQCRGIMSSLQRDLILLNNQIPFFVLSKLFNLIRPHEDKGNLIQYILFILKSLYPGAGYQYQAGCDPKHLLDLIHNNWLPPSGHEVYKGGKAIKIGKSIPPATVLSDANVRFQKRDCDTLFKVEFKKGILLLPPFKKGIMLLPPLTIRQRTECFFRNLIAYEQYFPNSQHTLITDYVRLMDCLTKSSTDIEILSRCGIIDIWLGNNQKLADIFEQLTSLVADPTENFVYARIFGLINSFYTERRTWPTPNNILLIATLLGLFFTFSQTVFSAIPVFKH